MSKVGLIGIGLVGKALADRLLQAGFELIGYDIDLQCTAELKRLGGVAVESCSAVATQVDDCIFSLPQSTVAKKVLDEIQSQLVGKRVIDTTTGDPEDSAAIGARLKQQGISYLDATIVGSSKQVRKGDVVVLVGGEEPVFEKCRSILSTFSKQSFYLGPWGSGARMKLVVNLVLGLNRAVLAEGLSFARACDIDPALALNVFRLSMAYSRIMDTKGEKMVSSDFSVEAKLSQHHKDVRLILSAAEAANQATPFSRLHDRLLSEAEALGLGEHDNSAIIEVFRRELNQF